MYLAVDLGGTKTRVASSLDAQNIFKENLFPTSQDLTTEKNLLLNAINAATEGQEVRAVCVGLPGMINKAERKLGKIVNVPTLSNLSYEELFSYRFPGDIITAENDAALAGLGEAVLGAGKDFSVVAYLTLSTGVGGICIADKKLRSDQNFIEPGHMIIKENDKPFSICSQRGCFAYYSSGTGFLENYREAPENCTNQEIWNDYAKNLSLGVINTIAMWGPNVIVLGGSMTKVYDQYVKEPLLVELGKQTFFAVPPLKLSVLGDSAGLLGGFVHLSHLLSLQL